MLQATIQAPTVRAVLWDGENKDEVRELVGDQAAFMNGVCCVVRGVEPSEGDAPDDPVRIHRMAPVYVAPGEYLVVDSRPEYGTYSATPEQLANRYPELGV